MAVTLSQLRAQARGLIQEESASNSHFTDSVLNGFINQGMEFCAVFIEFPRDLVSVTVQNNVGSYTNPADNLLIRTVYFGNPAIAGDVKPVKFVAEETLKEIYPSWLDQTSNSQADRPEYVIQIDRLTLHIFPRPNAVAAGKKLWINYNYVPASMTTDSDTPDIPVPYHNLLPLYAAHLCYLSLEKPDTAQVMFKTFMDKVKMLQSAVSKESKEGLSFGWGFSEGFDSTDGILLP